MTNNVFVFVIVDEGVIQNLVVEEDFETIKNIMAEKLRRYLDEHGQYMLKERGTEDGYANLYTVFPNGKHNYLLSYPFDGEETVDSVIERLTTNRGL
jgi:hypothetical protein